MLSFDSFPLKVDGGKGVRRLLLAGLLRQCCASREGDGKGLKIYPRLWSNISNISVTLVKYIEYIFDSDQTLCQGTGKEGLSYCDKDYCNSSNLASPLVGLLVAALVSVLVH